MRRSRRYGKGNIRYSRPWTKKTFKSYEELSARLDRVLRFSKLPGSTKVTETGGDPDDDEADDSDTGIDGRLKFFDQMKKERG